jgi:hypothetical protein
MKLRLAIQTLCDAEIEFVVIGGVCANMHGSATATFDLDICYSPARTNLSRLAGALAPFNPRPKDFPADLPFVWDEATIHNSSLLTLTTNLGEIDLLREVAGVGTYDEVKAASLMVEAYGRRFPILDLPTLIKAKRATGRTKDLLVLPELESLLEAEEP